jgi:predicted DNA-binding protein
MVGDKVKTTVRLREDLFLKSKLLATVRGESFNTIVNEAIEKYVQEHEDEIQKISEVVRSIRKDGGDIAS